MAPGRSTSLFGVICILLLSYSSYTQEYFSKVYDPHVGITDIGFDLEIFEGEIYILAIHRCSNSTVDCASVSRINEEGDLTWTSLYDYIDPGISSLSRKNDTLMVAGHVYNGMGNDSTILIQLLDTSGTDIATYEIVESGPLNQTETYGAVVHKQEIIVYGSQDLPELFTARGFMHRLDMDGNILKKQYYQDLSETIMTDLFLDENGNYIFNVILHQKGESKESRAIIKLDTLGNELYRWDSEPEFFLNGPENMVVLNNGNYVIKHDKVPQGELVEEHNLVCVDQEGNLLWDLFFYEDKAEYLINNMSVATNGDILICGMVTVFESVDYDFSGFIARVTQEGELLWRRLVNDATITGSFELCALYDIKEMNNGDLVATGNFRNTQSNDLWLIKTDADGCILPDCNPLQLITSTENLPQDIIGIEVYPNPSSGIFHFTVPEMTTAWNLEVYDLVGRSIFSRHSSERSTIDVDLTAHGSGVYIWKIGNGEGRQASGKKVVKVE